MEPFTYNASAVRIVFGHGTRTALADEIARLGCSRPLLLSTPQQAAEAERLGAALGQHFAGLFAGAVMHTPVEVSEAAVAHAKAVDADCLVAVGGGSTIGLGKAVALRTDLPQIVVPTTYAGSEATSILGQTADGAKTTLRSPKVLPEVILYDVDLTLTLPPGLTAVSGMNAIAHAVEALYAADRNPVTSMMAEQAVRSLARALPVLTAEPLDTPARAEALYGAWLSGTCLNAVGMGLHHKLCHTLGGTFDLPHAETHTIILPHAVRYNAPAAPDAMARIAQALGAADAAGGLFDLAQRLGAPTALAALGLEESDLDRAAALAVAAPYPNPRPLSEPAIRALLGNAFRGIRPSEDNCHA
ncbi:maleylacetate reductase [Aliidongia dinghuensis]|uniref:Maleylacetate reductase n=1 Tax=Aliidongia dinghuensis TaxID=1867774 RepID=A0A8J2YTZ0_9PROT|nr:maleylacetate reductase [Aliidongia dinghuensis]GGF20287.1 maleylacetate reductase [Aliidongia dinghuensis]